MEESRKWDIFTFIADLNVVQKNNWNLMKMKHFPTLLKHFILSDKMI